MPAPRAPAAGGASNCRLIPYVASAKRYENAHYRRCGRSGLALPAISLGLWQNFGEADLFEAGGAILRRAFDRGVTHFDLANNYGPPPGAAEERFGRMFAADFQGHRDEIIVSSKAGYLMWPGPYGEWGSRKSLLASLDASLKRLGLDYVDIFYHHRPDPKTPIEETMSALADAVRQGKALYVGISNYRSTQATEAMATLRRMGVACLVNQVRYSLLERDIEADGLLATLGGRGRRLCRLLAAAPGDSHRQISRRHPSGFARPARQPRRLDGPRGGDRRRARERAPAWRDRRPARHVAHPSRAEMGAPRRAHDLGGDRRAHGWRSSTIVSTRSTARCCRWPI